MGFSSVQNIRARGAPRAGLRARAAWRMQECHRCALGPAPRTAPRQVPPTRAHACVLVLANSYNN